MENIGVNKEIFIVVFWNLNDMVDRVDWEIGGFEVEFVFFLFEEYECLIC